MYADGGIEMGRGSNASLSSMDTKNTGLRTIQTFRGTAIVIGFIQVACLVLFGACCQVNAEFGTFTNAYYFNYGVLFMMFFGFGYLMTFLKRYGMGAVGFTMLITVLGIQWGILVEAFFGQVYTAQDVPFHFLDIDIYVIMNSLFLVAAVLISFGGVIGKASPLQLVLMLFFEAIFYSINKMLLCLGVVDFVDAGGTINIHMFGAYFGLAVAWMLGKPDSSPEAEGGHVSDLFSLFGTVFLWVYWPSFNGGALEQDSPGQQRAVVNTIIALIFAASGSFLMSTFLSQSSKFRPIDIQNATVAGGVAIGAVCDLTLNPSDAALIGLAGGCLSTFGYNKVLAHLEEHYGIYDTCGIHNLHGMPSLLGGVSSVILAAIKATREHDLPHPFIHRHQALDQFIAILFTLSVGISSGLLVGWFLTFFTPGEEMEPYSDTPFWEVMDDFGRTIDPSDELQRKIDSSLTELQAGLGMAKELQNIMKQYTQANHLESDSDSDSDESLDDDELALAKISTHLVPARHKASTMFGAGHKNSSMTTSRHGGGKILGKDGKPVTFTGQKTLNSSLHGSIASSLSNSRHGL